MNIQLLDTKVLELTFRESDPETEPKKFTVTPAFSSDDKTQFLIIFELTVETSDSKYEFNIKYVAIFSSDEDITEEKQKSHFFSVNAPAIGYPFLRSYVANMMLLSGYDPIMLQTVNFVKLGKEREEEEKETKGKASQD